MNKTFEKAFYSLSISEQEAIILNCGDGKDLADFEKGTKTKGAKKGELLNEGLMKLFIMLRERTEGDLRELSSFEEKVLEYAVAAGNSEYRDNYYR